MLEALQASADRPQSRTEGSSSDERAVSVYPGASGEGMTLPLGTVPFLLLQVGLLVVVFSIGFLAGQDSGRGRAGQPADRAARPRSPRRAPTTRAPAPGPSALPRRRSRTPRTGSP